MLLFNYLRSVDLLVITTNKYNYLIENQPNSPGCKSRNKSWYLIEFICDKILKCNKTNLKILTIVKARNFQKYIKCLFKLLLWVKFLHVSDNPTVERCITSVNWWPSLHAIGSSEWNNSHNSWGSSTNNSKGTTGIASTS